MVFFTELEPKNFTIHTETQNTLNCQKKSWERELEGSNFLTSVYTTKTKSPGLYGTGTKTEVR